MQRILVTGASGNIGGQVVKALENRPDVKVTAASRSSYAKLDFADAGTYGIADDQDAVFVMIPPLDTKAHQLVQPFLEYLAGQSTPPRVTYLSAYGKVSDGDMKMHEVLESFLSSSRLETTVLRPGFFASNFGIYERDNIEQRGIIFNPAGTGKTAFIDPVDIGEAAAATLTEAGHAGKIYTLTGPRAYTMHEVAAAISDRVGKKIAYPQPTPEVYRKVLADNGAPPFIADYMIPIYGMIAAGEVADVKDDLPALLGREAHDLLMVLDRDFGKTAA